MKKGDLIKIIREAVRAEVKAVLKEEFGKKNSTNEEFSSMMSHADKLFNGTKQSYTNMDISKYKDKHLKVIVEEKTDTNQFGEFIDRLHNEINTHEVNVIEDSYNINATADVNIIDQGEDTLTFLHNYINSLDTELDKARINSIMKEFYQEVQEK